MTPLDQAPGSLSGDPSLSDRAVDILMAWGRTPLARIASLPHYRHTLTAGNSSVVAWVDRLGCALALGEPVGPGGRRIEAIRDFVAMCRIRRLEPVFVPAARPAFEDARLRLFPIGQTAHLHLPTFTLEGSARRSVRQSVRRARRQGMNFTLWTSPGPDEFKRLQGVSDSWLSVRRLPERWFGTGRFEPETLGASRVGAVTSRFGRVEAFVSLVEGYAPGEAGVDLMRRRPDAPAGAMELLLSETAAHLADEGMRILDLGLAPLSGLGDGWSERCLGWIYRNGSRFYDFEGLYRFKNKFRPLWEPRYLAVTSPTALPRVFLALSEIGTRRFREI